MLVHYFLIVCLSARVEFKLKFEFNSLSEVQKPEKEKGTSGPRTKSAQPKTSTPTDPAQQPVSSLSHALLSSRPDPAGPTRALISTQPVAPAPPNSTPHPSARALAQPAHTAAPTPSADSAPSSPSTRSARSRHARATPFPGPAPTRRPISSAHPLGRPAPAAAHARPSSLRRSLQPGSRPLPVDVPVAPCSASESFIVFVLRFRYIRHFCH